MPLIHERNYVIVNGKKPFKGNEDYYDVITQTAMDLADNIGEPVFFKPFLRDQETDKVCEIVVQSKEYATRLGAALEATEMYRKVEVGSESVDLEKMASERGISLDNIIRSMGLNPEEVRRTASEQ